MTPTAQLSDRFRRYANADLNRAIVRRACSDDDWRTVAQLRKDGFQELDQSSEGDFADEGWPSISWKAEVRKVELPSMEQLQAIAQQQAAASNAQMSRRLVEMEYKLNLFHQIILSLNKFQ